MTSEFDPFGTTTFGRAAGLTLFKLAEGFTGSQLARQAGVFDGEKKAMQTI